MTGIEWQGMSPADVAASLRELSGALKSELEGAAKDIGQRIRGAAADNAPVDTGRLASSLEAVVENVSSTLVQIRVGSNLDYAKAHEFGVDAGEIFPPPSELRDWARRVLGNPDLAFPVAESIHETGLEEKRYLRDAFEQHVEWAVDRINDAVEQAIQQALLS